MVRGTFNTQRERETHWVRALYRETKELFVEHDLKLTWPTIVIHDSVQFWGQWDPLNLRISIAKTLIEECPWRVVVEILKHEIAHLITDLSYCDKEGPHGPRFRSVCERLRIESWARRASSGKSLEQLKHLSDWRSSDPDNETVKYRRRLRKLLALASSVNEHEAFLAMQRAQELRMRHRIENVEGRTDDTLVSLEISSGKQRHAAYEGSIASILLNHFQVEIVFCTRFNAATCKSEAIIDVMGRREDVLLAEYVHAFLHRSADSFWHIWRKQHGARGVRARNSYIRGLLAGYHTKLDNERDEQVANSKRAEWLSHNYELIRADQLERGRFLFQRYPRLKSRRSSARIDSNLFHSGKREGSKLNLRPPVGKSQGETAAPKQLVHRN